MFCNPRRWRRKEAGGCPATGQAAGATLGCARKSSGHLVSAQARSLRGAVKLATLMGALRPSQLLPVLVLARVPVRRWPGGSL